jgi:hypothetical protein
MEEQSSFLRKREGESSICCSDDPSVRISTADSHLAAVLSEKGHKTVRAQNPVGRAQKGHKTLVFSGLQGLIWRLRSCIFIRLVDSHGGSRRFESCCAHHQIS